MNIVLRKTLVVTEIRKKTSARLFKDLVVGDEIELSLPIKQAGRNGNSLYATYIHVERLKDNFTTHGSFNQLPKLLDCFEFEKVR